MSKPLKALGLMSGTSLDGIDVALLETDGATLSARGPAMTVAYDEQQRSVLRRALEDAKTLESRTARPRDLAHAEAKVTEWHAGAVHAFVKKHGLSLSEIDIIGFHGQTVIHRPERGLTVQIGNGEALANELGVTVAYDMRANDMLHGGQGAPLVPVYHRALAASVKSRPVAFVNIGGVANVTWVGADDSLVAFDTGPGNALVDDWMKLRTGTARDNGGATALTGHADEATVAQFLGDGFFESPAPKSLDRNTFAGYDLQGLSTADGAATLVAFTARAIAASQHHMPVLPSTWIICGGGRHNIAIMQALRILLPDVRSAEALGLDGDAIEAEAWAFLAVRCLAGLPITYPGTTGVSQPATGGVIARPSAANAHR